MRDGKPLKEGDTGYRPKLAATLQKIADNPRAFYNPNNQLAKDIAADVQDAGQYKSLFTINIVQSHNAIGKHCIKSCFHT